MSAGAALPPPGGAFARPAPPIADHALFARAPSLSPIPGPTDVDPAAYAAEVVGRSKSSFTAGMRILPTARRTAMFAIYALARIVDDIADGDGDAAALSQAERKALLGAWRGEIDAVYAGRPASLCGRALLLPAARFELPREEFLLLIDGMEWDADGPIRAPSMERLLGYTRRVAGAVGMLSMRAFEAWVGDASERFALALGDALQLTNILRDIERDAEMGRLYLPRELLEKHGAPTDDPWAAARHPKLDEVCAELGAMARQRFNAARAEIAAHRRWRLAPALMMMGAYEGYLDLLEARAWSRSAGVVKLSGFQKLGRGLRYVVATPPAGDVSRRAGGD